MWSYICALAQDHGFFWDEDFKNLEELSQSRSESPTVLPILSLHGWTITTQQGQWFGHWR